MARVVSSMSRTTPRRMPALRSTPTPEDPAPGVPRVAGHLGDERHRPWSSRGRARRPAAAAGRSCPRPADDHLAGEPPVELLVRAPLPGEGLLHRRHRSNVLRRKPGAEPEPPSVRPRRPRRDRPATRRRSARTAPGSNSLRPRQRARDQPRRRRSAPADRARSRADRRAAPRPRASTIASRSPFGVERHRLRLVQLDPQRARQPGCPLRRPATPGSARSRAAIGA